MEGTTSAAVGVCGGAGTLRMVSFWEGHLAERALTTPSPRTLLRRAQILMFFLDSVFMGT